MKIALMNNFSRISSHLLRWYRTVIYMLITALSLYSGMANACEGPEPERTIQIIQSLQSDGMRIGYQCGLTVNPFECMLQAFTAINETYGPLINNLSPSCRALIESVGNAHSGGGDGGTQCMGGVCCDSTGCYGP
jgi:hypothetical protein